MCLIIPCESQRSNGTHPGPLRAAWQRGTPAAQPFLAQKLFSKLSLTSSHSEAKDGDFSSRFLPVLQLESDSLRLPMASSSVGEQVSRSESDLDRLRLSLSSALGLPGWWALPKALSPSGSAPPGCWCCCPWGVTRAVGSARLTCCTVAYTALCVGSGELLRAAAAAPGEANSVSSSCIAAGWLVDSVSSFSVEETSLKGSSLISQIGEEPWSSPENCSGTWMSWLSAESWLRPPLLLLWSSRGWKQRGGGK